MTESAEVTKQGRSGGVIFLVFRDIFGVMRK